MGEDTREIYLMPVNPGLTINEDIKLAQHIEDIIWNGSENRFEMKASYHIKKKICDHKVEIKLKDGEVISVWAIVIKSLSPVDMSELKLIATRATQEFMELLEGDSINMSWEFVLEKVFNSGEDIRITDERNQSYKIVTTDNLE